MKRLCEIVVYISLLFITDRVVCSQEILYPTVVGHGDCKPNHLGHYLEVDGQKITVFSGNPKFLRIVGRTICNYEPIYTIFHKTVPDKIGGGPGDFVILVQSVTTIARPSQKEFAFAYHLIVALSSLTGISVGILLVKAARRRWNRFSTWSKNNILTLSFYALSALLGYSIGDKLAEPYTFHNFFIDNAMEKEYVVSIDSKRSIPISPLSHVMTNIQTGTHALKVSMPGSLDVVEELMIGLKKEKGDNFGGGTYVYNILGGNSYTITNELYWEQAK